MRSKPRFELRLYWYACSRTRRQPSTTRVLQARRLELEQAMLAEPPLDTKASVCELRFRFPEGEPETRRFLRDSATLHVCLSLKSAAVC